jgi:predicted regulator of Ras-like GTPase activity (Roadblock/LC7/MglB family)
MDAAQALRELTEISSQIEAACLFDSNGAEIASTLEGEGSASRFVEAARALLAEALSLPRDADADPGADAGPLAQLEAATLEGSIFLVIDGEHAVAAATKTEPTVGLVFYDLKSCLRALTAPGDEDGKPRPRARKREASASESAA